MTPPDVDEAESFVFPMRDHAHDDAMRGSDDDDDERICASAPPPRTPPTTRRSVMKLENILNGVSIGSSSSYLRSRSFCGSPRPPLPDVPFEVSNRNLYAMDIGKQSFIRASYFL